MEVIKNYYWALEYIPEYIKDEDFYLKVVEINDKALYHIPIPLRSEKICLKAVEKNGYALDACDQTHCSD